MTAKGVEQTAAGLLRAVTTAGTFYSYEVAFRRSKGLMRRTRTLRLVAASTRGGSRLGLVIKRPPTYLEAPGDGQSYSLR